MTFADAITDIRERTDQDLPSGGAVEEQPIKDSTIKRWINIEVQNVRRLLLAAAPALFATQSAFTASAGPPPFWTKAATFDRVRLVERKGTDGTYYPIEKANELDPEMSPSYAWRELGSKIEFFPSTGAAGDYRVTFLAKPAALVNSSDVLDVPDGVEDVVVERVCARVRRRFEESPAEHIEAAKAALEEALGFLQGRDGLHGGGFFRESSRA